MLLFFTSKLGIGFLGVLLFFVGIAGGELHGHHKGYKEGIAKGNQEVSALTTSYKEAQLKAEQAATQKDQELQAYFTSVEQKREQEYQDEQTKRDSTIADLRSGNLKLRKQWRGCQTASSVQSTSSSASPFDATTYLREEGAANLIGNAREADQWIKELQDILKKERQQ